MTMFNLIYRKFNSRPQKIAWLVLAVVCSFSTLAHAQLDEKGRRTLEMLLAAQQQQQAAFPRGSMNARLSEPKFQWTGKLTAIWDGDNYFVDAEGETKIRTGDKRPAQPPLFERVMLIARPEHLSLLNVTAGRLVLRAGDGKVDDRFAVRPQDVWYINSPGSKQPWSKKLEMQLADKSIFETSVLDLGDGRFHVINKEISTGGSFVTVYSMAHGGNVHEYHSIPHAKSRSRSRGRYQWQECEGNRWALKEYVYEHTSVKDEEFLNCERFSLIVDKFDPAPIIPQDRFQLSSFPLKSGIQVTNKAADGTQTSSKLGSSVPGKEISEAEFQKLVETLQKSSFGNGR